MPLELLERQGKRPMHIRRPRLLRPLEAIRLRPVRRLARFLLEMGAFHPRFHTISALA